MILLVATLIISSMSAQEICPIENLSVLGGDGRNIISWEEPANPFLVTFTVAITPDSWPTEISWDLVSNATGDVIGVNSFKDSKGEAINFSVSIDEIDKFLKEKIVKQKKSKYIQKKSKQTWIQKKSKKMLNIIPLNLETNIKNISMIYLIKKN